MTITNPLIPKPPTIDREFISRALLEVSDMARSSGQLTVALEALGMIAEIQGMIVDPS